MAFINNIFVEDVDTVKETIGFKLPFTLEEENLSSTTLESTKVNLISLLTTIKGERVFQPNLGVDIRKNLFEQITEESFVGLQEDIIAQIDVWLPFLQVENIDINPAPEENKVTIGISYSFKSSSEVSDSVQVDLNTGASY